MQRNWYFLNKLSFPSKALLHVSLLDNRHWSKADDTFHGQNDLSGCLSPLRFICSWNAGLSDFIQTKPRLHELFQYQKETREIFYHHFSKHKLFNPWVFMILSISPQREERGPFKRDPVIEYRLISSVNTVECWRMQHLLHRDPAALILYPCLPVTFNWFVSSPSTSVSLLCPLPHYFFWKQLCWGRTVCSTNMVELCSHRASWVPV